MANRRFEMNRCLQVLTPMRLAESDRAIARSGLMGRRKSRSAFTGSHPVYGKGCGTGFSTGPSCPIQPGEVVRLYEELYGT